MGHVSDTPLFERSGGLAIEIVSVLQLHVSRVFKKVNEARIAAVSARF